MARNYKHISREVHVKARGANLGKLKTARNRAEGASVAQWYNTYLLDSWLLVQSWPAAVHFSHKKDVLTMMVIDSSMEVCPVLLVHPKYK